MQREVTATSTSQSGVPAFNMIMIMLMMMRIIQNMIMPMIMIFMTNTEVIVDNNHLPTRISSINRVAPASQAEIVIIIIMISLTTYHFKFTPDLGFKDQKQTKNVFDM